ncbi:hypothetical protein [Effusibacillus dendaii]|nr:hypothetical protein [Effusibacillus dendaii]
MKWTFANMSIIASLLFMVVILFNFFVAITMPTNRRDDRKKDSK